MTVDSAIEEFKRTGILTNEMRLVLRPAGIINGLGPIRISRFASYLMDNLKAFLLKGRRDDFEADADYHDMRYYLGGLEEDRKKADIGFFDRLNSDILKLEMNIFKELYYLTLSYISYKLVRKYGSEYFYYL